MYIFFNTHFYTKQIDLLDSLFQNLLYCLHKR